MRGFGLQAGIAVGAEKLVQRRRLEALTPARAQDRTEGCLPGGRELQAAMRAEAVVVIQAISAGQRKATNRFALELQVRADLLFITELRSCICESAAIAL